MCAIVCTTGTSQGRDSESNLSMFKMLVAPSRPRPSDTSEQLEQLIATLFEISKNSELRERAHMPNAFNLEDENKPVDIKTSLPWAMYLKQKLKQQFTTSKRGSFWSPLGSPVATDGMANKDTELVQKSKGGTFRWGKRSARRQKANSRQSFGKKKST